jgi:ubiquinone/menaquinone biosynthesis C-methylase UbiE
MADLGCGSSKIIQDLPEAVALDLSIEKLRYIRKNNKYLINANLTALPFKNEVFSCIVCSQVIEHVSEERLVFKEMTRILRPEGILVLGTPDYGKLSWWIIEFFYGLLLPGGYKDKHVMRYTNLTLRKILESYNFKILAQKYICGSELIIKAKKKG